MERGMGVTQPKQPGRGHLACCDTEVFVMYYRVLTGLGSTNSLGPKICFVLSYWLSSLNKCLPVTGSLYYTQPDRLIGGGQHFLKPLSKRIPTCKAEARSTRNSASSLSKTAGLKGKVCGCKADGRQAEDPSYRLSGEQGQGLPHLWLSLLSVPSHAAPAGTGQTAPSTCLQELGQQHKETPRSSQSHEVFHSALVGQVSPN